MSGNYPTCTRPNFRSNLDTFFATNPGLFTGNDRLLGVVIHTEVNNGCVEKWKLGNVISYLRNDLALDPVIWISAAYGLTNIPGGRTDNGLHVDSNGNVTGFPPGLDVIGYWIYDIYNPNNDSHSLNKNQEPWSTIWNRVQSALQPGQQTVGILNAFCEDALHVNQLGWVTQCPNQKTWPLGYVARNWAQWWSNDLGNVGIIAFLWGNQTADPEITGTRHLEAFVRNEHNVIGNSLNCSIIYAP